MADLQEKTVIVTGGSKGLGASLARRFAQGGAQVVAAARSTAALEKLAEEFPGLILPLHLYITQVQPTRRIPDRRRRG